MKTKTIISSSVLLLSVLTISSFSTNPTKIFADDISSNLKGTPMEIPENAVQIIKNDSDEVSYTVKDQAEITTSEGEKLVAPVTVTSEVNSEKDGVVYGETTYNVNLEEAINVDDGENESLINYGFINFTNLFFPKAYAASYNQGTYTHDKGNHVSVSSKVNWQSSSVNKKISSVSGNYYIFTQGYFVRSARVQVGQTNLIQKSQQKTFQLGGAHNWSRNVNFSYMNSNTRGASGGANYYMTITNGQKDYSVVLYNTVWG